MGGLDKIIQQIEADAQAQAEQLLACGRKDADDIRAQAQADCERELAQIAETSSREFAACRARTASALEQQQRLRLLQTKQEIIGQTLAHALQTLQALPAEEYFAAIEKLVGRFARPEAGEIVFSQEDLDRMEPAFAEKLDQIARQKGGSLRLAAQSRPTGGGFLLCYGGVEENCTFPALFDARKEELQDLVHALLFT